MCGIAGLVRFNGLRPDERATGAVMAATLSHRGPDDQGLYHDTCASLGHARLSIIDLDTGHQPLSNEDGSVWVVFNGEIYNHVALADQLQARGHTLRTHCDTEVIVHLYEDHGEAFVEHLNGMFAIALWDARRRKIVLVRDRLGVKPLYWHHDGHRLVFGSELKALLAAGNLDPRTDPRAVVDYLTFGHVPAPRTIFENLHKLEPGFLAVGTASGITLRRYWDIPIDNADNGPLSPGEADRWQAEFAALFEDAVRIRLMADVPLGAFLSGGVDSSAVVAAMKRRGASPLLTHTVGFDEHDHDERGPARVVADHLATDHHEVLVRPDAAWAARFLARHFDEPFGDSSAVPTYYLSRVARERVKVALAGDGGDEMLAGYRRYRFDLAEAALRSVCPAWLRRPAAGLAGWLYPKGDWLPRPLRAKRTLQNLACDDATAHLRSVALHAGTLPTLLLRPEVLDLTGGYDPFTRGRDLFAGYPAPDQLGRLLYLDMKTLLPDDMLTKVDRASMAVGLEVRVPLLDYRLVELAARMPARLKLDGSRGKVVLRDIVAGWLGTQVADRPKKGFDVPVHGWFRGPLRQLAADTLADPHSRCHEWLQPAAVRRLLNEHQRGFATHGHVLWTMLAFELWARQYAGTSAAPSPSAIAQSRSVGAAAPVMPMGVPA